MEVVAVEGNESSAVLMINTSAVIILFNEVKTLIPVPHTEVGGVFFFFGFLSAGSMD